MQRSSPMKVRRNSDPCPFLEVSGGSRAGLPWEGKQWGPPKHVLLHAKTLSACSFLQSPTLEKLAIISSSTPTTVASCSQLFSRAFWKLRVLFDILRPPFCCKATFYFLGSLALDRDPRQIVPAVFVYGWLLATSRCPPLHASRSAPHQRRHQPERPRTCHRA